MRLPRRLPALTAVLAAALLSVGAGGSAVAAGQIVTFSHVISIPVPPASNFAGSAGGDGWAVAMTPTSVYNVFHHDNILQVACHLQTDASACAGYPKTITDASAHNFESSGQPGLWMDQATGRLYVYATRASDSTGGVVCIDTTKPASDTNPFCGFTALTPVGDAPSVSWSAISDPVTVGSKWYAFSADSGTPVGSGRNVLLCFDETTHAACASQPFTVPLGTGNVGTSLPTPGIAAAGGDIIVPSNVNSTDVIGCFDTATSAKCTGSWPIAAPSGYVGNFGAPYPMLSSSGAPTGFCLPNGTDPCFTLAGASTATPPGMAAAIVAGVDWNGPAVTIGPRAYVPSTDFGGVENIGCYDFAARASCAHFPKVFSNATISGLYTVNPDPQRPNCLWINADGGADQIQNFDAFSGGACGQGPIRVIAASFIAGTQQCIPTDYTSLQVLSPTRNTYSSGIVSFQDGDANPIPGVPNENLDASGAASLVGLHLNTATGLPQFLITLNNPTSRPGTVQVKVVWQGVMDPSCNTPGTTVSSGDGLMMIGGDGGMFGFGQRDFVGAADFGGAPGPLTTPLGQVIPTPFTAIAAQAGGTTGYWGVLGNGQLFPVGTAKSYGDLSKVALAKPIVGIASTPDGKGYWMVGSDGGVFAFGDAVFHGSLATVKLAAPIAGVAAAPTGSGYWLVGKDGGVFRFGSAGFFGSFAGTKLAAPITDIISTHDGAGYYLAGTDGGVFTKGNAVFHGSQAGTDLAAPIVAIALDGSGAGYWLIGGDGGVFTEGDAPFVGSVPALGVHLRAPIVGAVN